jgi:hypothetical protein
VPVATIADHSVAVGSRTQVQSWLSYSDADTDPAIYYQFVDTGTAAGSGRLWTPSGGYQPVNSNLTVYAADLGTVSVEGGTVSGSETMYVRAFDGRDWSVWDPFTLTTVGAPNTAPVATIGDHSGLVGERAQVLPWVSYSDADGNAAVYYQFVDTNSAAGSAQLWTAGTGYQAANANLTVTGANLSSVYVGDATSAGSDTIYVRAFDGQDWSAWDPFNFTSTVPNSPPVATISDHSAPVNSHTQIQSWVSYSDANSDAAVYYQFVDVGNAAGSSSLWTQSLGTQAVNANLTVTAANLNTVYVDGGTAAGSETMYVRAFDGHDWGNWDPFSVTTT